MSAAIAAQGQSLSRSLSLGLAIQAFAILGLVCALVYVATSLTLSDRQDATLVEKKAMVRHLLAKTSANADKLALEHMLKDFLIGHEEMGLVLKLADGRFLSAGMQPEPDYRQAKRLEFVVSGEGFGTGPSAATLYMDTASDAELLRRLAWILGVCALAGAVIVSAGSSWMVRQAMAPLHGLVQQLRHLRADRLDMRLDGSLQPEELQPVIAQFNELLDRLDRAYRQLEAFNADVAHELNTPLSVLIGSCQLGLQRTRSIDELREILARNLEDLDRMAGIVRDMLFLAKADQGGRIRQGAAVSLRQIALEVVDFHDAALQEAGVQVVVIGDAQIVLDTGLMRRALSNLLSNATRYAEGGSSIYIRIETAGSDEWAVAVENQGPVISAAELRRIFERFYRADHARSRSDVNHGLGLAIVDAIASMHGGRTFAYSDAGRTQVGMYLPQAHRALEQIHTGSPS
jgi:two-component system heavy metal sensor histidine kinase CusS